VHLAPDVGLFPASGPPFRRLRPTFPKRRGAIVPKLERRPPDRFKTRPPPHLWLTSRYDFRCAVTVRSMAFSPTSRRQTNVHQGPVYERPKNLHAPPLHPRFTPRRFAPEPREINTSASSVNGLRPSGGIDFRPRPLASWNHQPRATSPSGEQTSIRGKQPILPLFVLTLCQWLMPQPGTSG
jgi:hypothetical protein